MLLLQNIYSVFVFPLFLSPAKHMYSEAPQVALPIITCCPAQISLCSSETALEIRSVPHQMPINLTHPTLPEPLIPAHTPTVNHCHLCTPHPSHETQTLRWTCFIKPANNAQPCPRPAPRQPGKWSALAGGDLRTENSACWLTSVTMECVDRCRSNKRCALVPTWTVRKNIFKELHLLWCSFASQ